jgi:hypothetical protein
MRSEGVSDRIRSVTWVGNVLAKWPREAWGSLGLLPGFRPAPGRRPPQVADWDKESESCDE